MMKIVARTLTVATVLLSSAAGAQTPPSLTTPDKVESRLGTLTFKDGIPSAETGQRVYDQLDFQRGVDSFVNGLPAASMYALRKAFREAGVRDNEGVLIFSELMDSKSLFLTANCDTVYFWPFIDLSKGPMVLEVPRDVLGVIDDMWFRWIVDVGAPGPDRGQGGKYLVVPPGYKGPLPEGGFFVVHSRTYGVGLLGRAFLENNDPKPAVERIKAELKIYPYAPGGYGTSIASFLAGEAKLGPLARPPALTFVEGTGRAMNTIYPNDASFYEIVDAAVQEEPAEALDPEIAGQLAAIGIVKGKPFKPDERMKKILTEAVAVGNAASRVISMTPRASEGFTYYDKSAWSNTLFAGGYEFMNPPPRVTKDGVKPFPSTGARLIDSRAAMFYLATGITPAMVMRLTNIGSAYLGAFFDAKGAALDGGKTYKLTLPAKIPAANFWSLTLYDNQTRSMLQTGQRYPRAGSQSYPSPAAAANADGSTTVWFGPKKPDAVPASNFVETVPGKGWWTILRLYSPLEPFFDKSWRPSEIEEVK